MPLRLQLKTGLVGADERVPSSADTVLVTEPSIGSRARSKGNLYTVVTARGGSVGRLREVAALVAETVRREYYYDESAGIPICLQKAVRSANRRLRQGREGHGLPPGAIGVALAVVRGNELYVASIGEAEVYLIRHARLLMPEHEPGPGMPDAREVRLDVWRGDFAVGDEILLVSRNVTERVGTEELKNALVTLHPQSAVEHLHHLFVAAAGEGSDAILTVEAAEPGAARAPRRLVPVGGGLDEEDDRTREAPLVPGRPLAVAAAVQDRTREAIGGAAYGVLDRLRNLVPRRRAYAVAPLVSARETRRRAAVALLVSVLFVGGLGVFSYLNADRLMGRDREIRAVDSAEQAFARARVNIEQGMAAGDDEDRARELLRAAWRDLETAEAAGVSGARLQPLRAQAAEALDALYDVRHPRSTVVFPYTRVGEDAAMTDLVRGPDGAAYTIDTTGRGSVVRVDVRRRAGAVIVRPGDGPGAGVGKPLMLAVGGPDLLILDNRGALWRWRPSGGMGTLGQVRLGGRTPWGADIRDIATYLVRPEDGLYNLYVVDPSQRQILRYLPTLDGSGFSPPSNYVVGAAENVDTFLQLYIDGHVYALTARDVVRHDAGKRQEFSLEEPPDQGDVRPEPRQFVLFAGSGPEGQGRLYVWDRQHARILAYDKASGRYEEQFVAAGRRQGFRDLQGMYVIEGDDEDEPAVLVWSTEDRLFSTVLRDAPTRRAPGRGGASGSPSAAPGTPPAETTPAP